MPIIWMQSGEGKRENVKPKSCLRALLWKFDNYHPGTFMSSLLSSLTRECQRKYCLSLVWFRLFWLLSLLSTSLNRSNCRNFNQIFWYSEKVWLMKRLGWNWGDLVVLITSEPWHSRSDTTSVLEMLGTTWRETQVSSLETVFQDREETSPQAGS